MGYTEAEWEEMVKSKEGLAQLVAEKLEYAESKGVERRDVDVRWVNGVSQWFIRHREQNRGQL